MQKIALSFLMASPTKTKVKLWCACGKFSLARATELKHTCAEGDVKARRAAKKADLDFVRAFTPNKHGEYE